MTTWALSLRRSQSHALAKLHNVADVRIGDLGELVWACGAGTESEVEQILTRVPSSRFFEVVHHDRLRPRGRLLPTARLPHVRWVPLREWLSIRIPTPAIPGELSGSAELRLVFDHGGPVADSGEELLLCNVEAFREFLLRSPRNRLRPLRFVLHAGIATPARRAWSPPVGASVIRAWLGLRDGTIALWRADGGGGISEIAEDAFVAASRRAGRKL